jgi:hypothetical protein
MPKHRSLSVYLRIISVLIIFSGCSSSSDLEGTWYYFNGDELNHSFWDVTSSGQVIIQKLSSTETSHYTLHTLQDTLYLKSDDTEAIKLGTTHWENDSLLAFSNGSKLFQIYTPTVTKYTKEQVTSYISNQSALFLHNNYFLEIHFSDSANHLGYKSADILYDEPSHRAEFNNSWLLSEFGGTYVINFATDIGQIGAILIDSIEDTFITGEFIFESTKEPITLKVSGSPNSKSDSTHVNNILKDATWSNYEEIELIDTSLPDIKMEALAAQPYLTFEDYKSADIEVEFLKNNTMIIRNQSDSNPFEMTYYYKFSVDSKYLFTFDRLHSPIYSDVTPLQEDESVFNLYIMLPIIFDKSYESYRTVKIPLLK